MRPPSFRGGRLAFFLAAGTLAAGLWAEASPAPAVRAAEKPAVREAGPAKAGKPPNDAGANATIPPAVEIEIQRRFNEIEKERLDDRAAYIDRWLAGIAILFVIGGFLSYWTSQREGQRSVEEAKKHSEEAKRLVEEITAYRDKSQALLNMTAENFAEMSKDDPEKARQATQEVRENRQASLIDKAVAAALSLQQEGKRDEAIEIWRGIAKVAEGGDDDLAVISWFSVGYLLGEQGKYEEAISACDEAIRLNPNLAEAYNNRGNAKKELGRHKAAMADYDEAIRLKPDHVNAYLNRGVAKWTLGQYEAARADFDEAIRLNPDDADAYCNRGAAKSDLGQRKAAIKDYDEAIRRKPNYADAYFNRGLAKSDLGQHKAAIKDYDEALRLDPNLAEAYLNRGVAFVVLGDKEASRRDFGKARELARATGDEPLAADAEQALKELDEQGP